MTERYGKRCGLCGGGGIVKRKDPILLTHKNEICPNCDGNGRDGDALYAPKNQEEIQYEEEYGIPEEWKDGWL